MHRYFGYRHRQILIGKPTKKLKPSFVGMEELQNQVR